MYKIETGLYTVAVGGYVHNPRTGQTISKPYVIFSPETEFTNPNFCLKIWRNALLSQDIWATARQIQQSDMCAQRRVREAWATAQSDQSSLSAWRSIGS